MVEVVEMNYCRSCGGTQRVVDYRHGEVLCRNCGMVLGDALYAAGPERHEHPLSLGGNLHGGIIKRGGVRVFSFVE